MNKGFPIPMVDKLNLINPSLSLGKVIHNCHEMKVALSLKKNLQIYEYSIFPANISYNCTMLLLQGRCFHLIKLSQVHVIRLNLLEIRDISLITLSQFSCK